MTTPSTDGTRVARSVDPAPRAMLVAVTGTGDGNIQASPPKTPWQIAFTRLMSGVAIVLPVLLTFIVDPVVLYVSQQTVALPDEFKQWQPIIAIVLTGAVLAYQTLRKQQKEAGRQDAANTLTALGVPIGLPLSASDARKVTE